MTHQEREKLINDLLYDCELTRNTKGLDYAGIEDPNANFKTVGERLGINPKQVLLVYLLKHMDRITNTIKANPENPQPHGETLYESIKDSINYLSILSTL